MIYFAHPIFNIYRKFSPVWCKIIIRDAIQLLLNDKLVSHNGPSIVITTMNRQVDKKRDILHILHYITEKRAEMIHTIEDVIPLYNIEFKIYVGDNKVKGVQLVPSLINLDYCREDNYLSFNMEKIEGHEMVCIQY